MTSAQPPTSWEEPPDRLGARNADVERRSRGRRGTLHDARGLPKVLGACTDDLGGSVHVRGRLSEGSGMSFRGDRNDGRGPESDLPRHRKGSHVLGALSHALGRTTQVVGNGRPCLQNKGGPVLALPNLARARNSWQSSTAMAFLFPSPSTTPRRRKHAPRGGFLPRRLIGDKAYDDDKLERRVRRELRHRADRAEPKESTTDAGRTSASPR